jgi:hypothetical protein
MINKLRKDFAPQYLAAVYDVGAPVHRNELAGQLKDVQKFNIKTQDFETVEYGGYKANRAETPPDLIQQQPYIRRALEAFRIPILYNEGFEADDVIGTLSCQLSALGHHVYVVSPDKDMMQLVNPNVSILNPTKDNLILDPAGVAATLGVPPERVVDVMALRGDSIDNIPGAPGIGDKGSVELIQQFGTVEAALDRAEEVKKKTYRESLRNNRENILLSKELVTPAPSTLRRTFPAASPSPSSKTPGPSPKKSPPTLPTTPNPNHLPLKTCLSSEQWPQSTLHPTPYPLHPRLPILPAASASPSPTTLPSKSRSTRPVCAKHSKTHCCRRMCTTSKPCCAHSRRTE